MSEFAEILRAVNNLRETVESNHREVNGALRGHMEDEEEEIKEIRKQGEERAKLADQRHTEIMAAINAVNIVDALPKADGKPDIHGHRNDHETRIEDSKTWRRRFDLVTATLMVSATVGVLLWLGRLAWVGFLQGPVK